MNIIIRVDASSEIGTGHVMRCLTLAYQFKESGCEVLFVCRELIGDCIELIRKSNFQVLKLPKITSNIWGYTSENWLVDAEQTINLIKGIDLDLIIVDHYSLDEKWERKLASYTKKIMIIDDLADRKHYCNFLIDHNEYLNFNTRYNGLVPEGCSLFLGSRYALLRKEFTTEKNIIINRNGHVKDILVSFGGSDPTNETLKVLKVLSSFKDLHVHAVVGSSNIYSNIIKNYCNEHNNFNYYFQVNNMAELINICDIGIGAGGVSTWERCSLGLPSLVVATAENQVELSKSVNKKGIIKYLGYANNISEDNWEFHIKEFIGNKELLIDMEKKSLEIIDGFGTGRIVEKTLNF